MDMTTCGSCGAGAARGARFCAACGQKNPGMDPSEYTGNCAGPSGSPDGGLGSILRIVVLAAGVLVSLVAFAKALYQGGLAGYELTLTLLPLTAGLLAGVSLLPRQTEQRATVAAVAVAGFVPILFVALQISGSESRTGAAYLTLLLTLVQAAAAVVALLVHSGVVSMPSPRPGPALYDSRGYGPPSQFDSSEYGPSAQPGAPNTGYGAPMQPPPGYSDPAPFPPYGQPGQYGPPAPIGTPAPGPGSPQDQQQSQPPGRRSYDPPTQVFPSSGTGWSPENPEGGPRP